MSEERGGRGEGARGGTGDGIAAPASSRTAAVESVDAGEHHPSSEDGQDGRSDGRAALERLLRAELRRLGEDPDRPGLQRTPERVADAFRWLTRGYRMRVEDAIGEAVYEEPHDSMVLVKDIELYSLCEHHLMPFFGKAHVAYIPDGRIVGLSKLPRIVEVFARRLQVQERLTEEIAGAIEGALAPRGVGVVVEAYHLCMMMRGVEKQNSKTITSAVRGSFRKDQRTREEFLRLALSPQFLS